MTVRITKPKINVREALNNTDNISFLDLEQRGVKVGESGSETESVLTLNNTDNMFPALVIKGSNSGSTTGYKNDAIEAENPDGYKEQNVGIGPWIVMDNDSNGLADGYPKTAGIVFKANNAEGDYHLAGGYDYAYMMFKRTNSPDNNAAQIELGTQSGGTDMPAKTRMTIDPQGNIGINNSNPQYYFDQYINNGQNSGERKIHRSLNNEVVTGYDLGTSGGQSSVVTVTVGIGWLRGVTLVSDFTGSRNSSGPDSYMQRFAHALQREGNSLRLSTRLTNLEYAVGSSAPISVGTGAQAPYVDGDTIVITYLIAGGSVGYDSRMLFTGKGPGITDISVSAVKS